MALGYVITAENIFYHQSTVVVINADSMVEALEEFNTRWHKLSQFDKVTVQATTGMSGYIDQKRKAA